MLSDYGISKQQIEAAYESSKYDVSVFITNLLKPTGHNINYTLALLSELGEKVFINDIAQRVHTSEEETLDAYESFWRKNSFRIVLTGAEATSLIIRKAGIQIIFAYPGTSELSLCNSILRTPGLTLINGRGDKESAFMAAGGCLLSPVRTAAILHGARGLTNAAGAIADTNRNEIGSVYFVGLPSLTSAPFLPPHGERNLINNLGNFVKFHTEITDFVSEADSLEVKQRNVYDFVNKITNAIQTAQQLPFGPTIIGLPQDVMEQRWIPYEFLKDLEFQIIQPKPSEKEIQKAISMLCKKSHPVILIDDYLFKTVGAKEALRLFAETLHAPVIQIRYSRGPMLFERLSPIQNPYFAGSYDSANTFHRKLMANAGILITLEDRNGYPRIIGALPNCEKIAITSHATMTKKNNYLNKGDLLLNGNIAEILSMMIKIPYVKKRKKNTVLEYCNDLRRKSAISITTDKKYFFMRHKLVELLAELFQKVEKPILVDDSQMFGGMLFEGYDSFPEKLRVFGDHGAFIGGGMAIAAGLALSMKNHARVFCCIGDQSFTNAIQSLVSVVQEKIPVVYIVCNNGKSVSLLKQALSQDIHAFDDGNNRFLHNDPNFHYADLAKTLGIMSYTVIFDPESHKEIEKNPEKRVRKIFNDIIQRSEPVVIELVLPSNPAAWKGIWSVKGNESSIPK